MVDRPRSSWSLRRIRRWFAELLTKHSGEEMKAQIAETQKLVEAEAVEARVITELHREQQTQCVPGTPTYRRYMRYYRRVVRLMGKYRAGKQPKPDKVKLCKAEIERAAALCNIAAMM